VDTANSQKKSPRNLARNKKTNQEMAQAAADRPVPSADLDYEPYFDRSFDMVARVRAAKEAAQRRIEAFGDVSEYEVTTIQGQKKVTRSVEIADGQATFEFNAQPRTVLPPEEH
jgi:hypothetical protein